MKRLATLSLLSVFFAIQSAFAGPFGIEMGMSLAEVRQVCMTVPELIQDNVYEITPPKTNDMFETYYVRIDPEYGVYWLKAIGKDIYTNSYGDRVRSRFESLVESISKTYGEESLMKDEVKEESREFMKDPENFMIALESGNRTLQASWSNNEQVNGIIAVGASLRRMNELLDNPEHRDEVLTMMSDSIALRNFLSESQAQYEEHRKERFGDVSMILLYATARSSSLGSVWLEYSFSNSDAVDAREESVF